VDRRNPAPPKGWLKPIQSNGMFITYQLMKKLQNENLSRIPQSMRNWLDPAGW